MANRSMPVHSIANCSMHPSAERSVVVTLRPRRPLVVIFADPGDSHARAIARYLRGGGASVRRMRLRDCSFDSTLPNGLHLPGLCGALPDAVLVRAISAGTFEQVTYRLGILHALREAGVLVWNDARAIERCVDKSTTAHLLAAAGLPVPQSWSVEGIGAAERVVRREAAGGPMVLKRLFGAQGRGLTLIRDVGELPPPDEVAGIYHLQRFVGDRGAGEFRDYRVFVLRGAVIAAMERRSSSWITNVKQGGRPIALQPSKPVAALAVCSAAAVGVDFCGVDILPGPLGPVVLEVNSMPAWSGLQKVTKPRISAAIADSLLSELASGRTWSAVV